MKEILKKIIENYFTKDKVEELFSYDLELDNSLLIIKSKKQNEEPSDFFYFIFKDEKSFYDLNDSKIFKKLKEEKIKNNNLTLGEIPSFDKNLNFLIFVKVENDKFLIENNNDLKDNEKELLEKELLEKAYLLEEDAFYARKKVMFYCEKQIEEFSNYDLDISNLEQISKDMSLSDKFLLDLVVTLTFIKIDFNKNDENKDQNNFVNNIFEESFKEICKIEEDGENLCKFGVKINGKSINLKLFTKDESEFRKKIEDINNNRGTVNIQNNDITQFEKDLISLFGEGKGELEKEILSLKITDNENRTN